MAKSTPRVSASVRYSGKLDEARSGDAASKNRSMVLWRIAKRQVESRLVFVVQYDTAGQDERAHWHEDVFTMWDESYDAERERALARGYAPENEVKDGD